MSIGVGLVKKGWWDNVAHVIICENYLPKLNKVIENNLKNVQNHFKYFKIKYPRILS